MVKAAVVGWLKAELVEGEEEEDADSPEGCAKPDEVGTASVKAEVVLVVAGTDTGVVGGGAVASGNGELMAGGVEEAGVCPSAGPSGGRSPSGPLGSPGAEAGASSWLGATSGGAVGCPPPSASAGGVAKWGTSAGRCSGTRMDAWGSTCAVGSMAPSVDGGFPAGAILASSSPLLARAAGVAAAVKRPPNERLGADGGRTEPEEACGALAGGPPKANGALAALPAGTARPKMPGGPGLTKWTLPKIPPVAGPAVVVAKAAGMASAALLADRVFPAENPGGGGAAAVPTEGPLAGVAFAFSSAWPTLRPEKLPNVSPAAEAWIAVSPGLRVSSLGAFAKGREASAACPLLLRPAGSPGLALPKAEGVGVLGPPKVNGVSGTEANFIPPPREKASG